MKNLRRITSLIMALILVALSTPVQNLTANAASAPLECVFCATSDITWSPLPDSGELTTGHYVLDADKEIAAPYTIAEGAVVCVYFQGANLTSTDKVFNVTTGTLNIVGEGVIMGAGATDASTILCNGGKVNLAGATVKHAATTAYPSVMQKTGTVTIYDGAVLTADEGAVGTNLYIAGGTLRMHGGVISNGVAATKAECALTACSWGGNVLIKGSGTNTAGFYMYGGEIYGGRAEYGGNIGIPGHFTGTGSLSLRIYGGKIYNGEATHASGTGGNIHAISKTHRVIMRIEEQAGTPVEIFGGKAFNGGNICLAYSAVTDTDGAVTSTAPFFALRGCKIYDGIATNRGGNLYLAGSFSANIGASNDTTPTDPAIYQPTDIYGGQSAQGGNIYAACSSLAIREIGTVRDGYAAEYGPDIYLSGNTKYTISGTVDSTKIYRATFGGEIEQTVPDRIKGNIGFCEHCGETVTWKPWAGGAVAAENCHYYLHSDTTSTQLTLGNDDIDFEVVIDLNGKTFTSKVRAFLVYKGEKLSIIDSVGGGKVIGNGSIENDQGSVIRLANPSTVDIYGGTFTMGPDAMSTFRGGVVVLNGVDTVMNMYGGSIEGGVATYAADKSGKQGGGNIFINLGTVNLLGGTVSGGQVVGGAEGANIYNYKGTLNITGCTVDGGIVTYEPTITPTEPTEPDTAPTESTEPSTEATEPQPSEPTAEELEIARLNALDNSKISDKFAEGTTKATCPYCQTEVEWTALSQNTASSSVSLESGHYYLAESLECTYGYSIAAGKQICLHLNGNSLVTTAGTVFNTTSSSAIGDSTLNLMGEGIISTSGNNTVMLFKGYANLLGGTIKHTGTATSVALQRATGILNLYNGVTFDLDEGVKGGSITVLYGTLNMYGGTINKGIVKVEGQLAGSTYPQYHFHMYGGTIKDGISVSNNYVRAQITISGNSIILPNNGGMTISGGKLLTIGNLGKNASISVTAEGTFTNTLSDPASVINHFSSASPNRAIYIFDNALAITDEIITPDPTEPTEPSTEPTEPSTEPTEPSTEPTEPSTEATEPTEPSTEATEPSEPESGNCATIFFNDKQYRTSFTSTQQIWEQNGITFINDKANSTTNIADYANPVRLYKNSSLSVSHAGMTAIIFNCDDTKDYANTLMSSIPETEGMKTTVDGALLTVTFASPVDSFTVDYLTFGQVRIHSITVFFTETSSEDPDIDLNNVYQLASAMHFNVEGETHKCPFCNAAATWNALPASNGEENVILADGHYYVAESLENTRPYSIEGNVCIHLNGKDITSANYVFITSAEANLTVMGKGVITGASTSNGAVMTVNGTLNLCGGTFHRAESTTTHLFINPATCKNAVVNVYEGTVVESNGESKNNLFRVMAEGSQLNIYGGEFTGAAIRIALYAQMYISGSPVIEKLQVAGSNKLMVGKLTEGAMIAVDIAANNVITTAMDDPAAALPYFTAVDSGKTIIISNNALIITEVMNGDINGDGYVTDADAVYLLRHALFPDEFPVSDNCDFNGDGVISDADAVRLLLYTLYPQLFPLSPK